jgi:hypothetical protein
MFAPHKACEFNKSFEDRREGPIYCVVLSIERKFFFVWIGQNPNKYGAFYWTLWLRLVSKDLQFTFSSTWICSCLRTIMISLSMGWMPTAQFLLFKVTGNDQIEPIFVLSPTMNIWELTVNLECYSVQPMSLLLHRTAQSLCVGVLTLPTSALRAWSSHSMQSFTISSCLVVAHT